MLGEWCYYLDKFSTEACEEVIGLALSVAEIEGGLGGASGEDGDPGVNKEIRKSNVVWLRRLDPNFAGLFAVVDQCVWEANNTWFGIDYQYSGADSYQFTIYRESADSIDGEGDFYHTHADTAWVSRRPSQRKISFVLQLSDPDDYEGGELQMDHVSRPLPVEETKRRGSLVIFPSVIRHRVTPVTSGVRYSLVGWYMGPPWR